MAGQHSIGGVHAVLAVHNRKILTARCLEALLSQTIPLSSIIVVDDGSTDGTSEMIRMRFPSVELVRADGTLFWTRAMRLGVETALRKAKPTDYIFVTNDDLRFSHDFVEILLRTMETHSRAVVHAVTVYEDNQNVIEFGGVRVNWWTAKATWINKGRKLSEFPPGYLVESDMLWGRGLLVPVEAILKAGNYDPRYQQSGDGTFTRRLALAGYKLLVSYDAVGILDRPNFLPFNERESYRFCDLWKFFFGVHSNSRIYTIYLHSKLRTTSRLQASAYFLFSVLRSTGYFLRRVRLRA